ncbi:hypothetical protein [Vibrio pectenicida]|uniref:Uncharacterized protein n=1 Tax=Vibrio pectenicida TaxID=62763 RepID=A0A3R9FL32_9VIBR|nr:hypothetical protein [Vibrio pectenicida]RSD28907.1 hypothetical protein EJA03_18865 [Vibrio pectenicida]
MRQRITPQQLSYALSQQDFDQSIESLNSSIADLDQLKPSWLQFCREKSQLARESFSFLFRQWVRLHRNGYPATDQDYLRLVEREMFELKQVYIALFNLHPGLVYEQKDLSPELFIWLMLELEFSHQLHHLHSALNLVQDIDEEIAMLMFLKAKAANLDLIVAQSIEGGVVVKHWCFDLLKRRQTLSIGLTKHWLKNKSLDDPQVHSTLAKFDVEESIEWISTQENDENYLFELLLCKHDRGTWFRKRFGTDESALTSDKVMTYAKLLELREFRQFTPSNKMAPIQLALSAQPSWLEVALEYFTTLGDDDENEGEEWLFALYIVYGEKFPLKPHELGIEYDWNEAKDVVQSWCEEDKHYTSNPMRLGEVLSYQSTLRAMQHPCVPERYRVWLWRQVCMHGRVYMPWHWAMPSYQQDWLFDKLKQQTAASERFNLRNQNATVGY